MNADDVLASMGRNVDSITVEDSILNSAQQSEKKGDYRKASQHYFQLTTIDKDNDEYKYKFADLARRAGEYEAAIATLKELSQRNPSNLDYKESLGLALMSSGERNTALPVFSEIIKEDPTRWRSLNAVGIAFALQKRTNDAVAYFKQALKQNPDSEAVLNNVGLAMAVSGDYGSAIKALEKASKLAGKSSRRERIDMNLALVYGISGDLDAAERVAKPHLTEPELYNNLGYYAYLANNDELARSYLNMALTESPAYYQKAWENLEKVAGGGSTRSGARPGGR